MKKYVALDIGDVCLEITPALCAAALGYKSEAEMPSNLAKASEKIERGIISEREWLNTFQRETGYKFSDNELLDAWNLMLGDELSGIYELLEGISGLGYSLIFFSDTSTIHIQHIYHNLSVMPFISGGVYSFEVRAKKPESVMYEAFEELYGKPFFFVDNKLENVEAGRMRGWYSHLFIGVEEFRKDFMSRHLLSSGS